MGGGGGGMVITETSHSENHCASLLIFGRKPFQLYLKKLGFIKTIILKYENYHRKAVYLRRQNSFCDVLVLNWSAASYFRQRLLRFFLTSPKL